MARHERNIRTAFMVSGQGRTAESILAAADTNGPLRRINPVLMISSNQRAGALEHAEEFGVPTLVTRMDSDNTSSVDAAGVHINRALERASVDLVVLTGWREAIPTAVAGKYWNNMIEQHPAPLDPGRIDMIAGIDNPVKHITGVDFGGPDMRGSRTHGAVLLYASESNGRLQKTEATAHRPGDEVAGPILKRTHYDLEIPPSYLSREAVLEDPTIQREFLERTWQLEEDMLPTETANMLATLRLVEDHFEEFKKREKYNTLYRRSKPLVPQRDRELVTDIKRVVTTLFPRP